MAYRPSDKSSPFEKSDDQKLMPMKKPAKGKKKSPFGKAMKKRGM